MQRWAQLIFFMITPLLLTGCVRVTLAWADLKPSGTPATPTILTAEFPYTEGRTSDNQPINTTRTWEGIRKPAIQQALQDHIYGALPDASSISIISKTTLDTHAFDDRGTLEEITLSATATFGTQKNESQPFIIELIVPNNVNGPVPLILKQSFSPRWSAVPHPKVTGRPEVDGSSLGGIGTFIFGRYVGTPPIADILDRGYAIAIVYASELVPDNSERGLTALRNLSKGHENDNTRWGSITAWAWGYSRMIDAIADDPRIRKDGYITYGHSRYGKAALVAAAFDDRISAVVSHQSGTGGASLNRRKKGESIKQITQSYPHWFSKKYASYAGIEETMPIDQHHLLAVIAPRPIFLGNARRDVWSDPNGTLKAAIGADPVWKLYGSNRGLQQAKLIPFIPDADLSLWIRPGTHGVVKEDWPAFLSFLDAHYK